MISFVAKSHGFSSPLSPSTTNSGMRQPAKRQTLQELKKTRDLIEQLNALCLSNQAKEQQIAVLNRELQSRDRLISLLRRKASIPLPLCTLQKDRNHGNFSNKASELERPAMIATQPNSKMNKAHYVSDTRHSMSRIAASNVNEKKNRSVNVTNTTCSVTKKPTDPFVNYCLFNRGVMKMRNPAMTAGQVTRVLVQSWHSMNPSERSRFFENGTC